MGFELIVKGTDAQAIATNLHQLLDEVTEPEVLGIEQEFYTAQDKHAFLAQFESAQSGVAAQKNPVVLERWTHYHWLRLELIYLAHQRAALNRIEPNVPHIDSINRAILESKEAGSSMLQSIDILRRIKLQIVNTEHPTDPLSQQARDTLTKIAHVMEIGSQDSGAIIRDLLKELQGIDAIPPCQRSVEEEVQRTINTLEQLYDNVPAFINSIVTAYKTYYAEVFPEHEEALWRALEEKIIADASWAGFDADGNDNVTPDRMSRAIQMYRIKAVEKHIAALDTTVVQQSKRIEEQLYQHLLSLNEQLITASAKQPLQWLDEFHSKTRQLLVRRSVEELSLHYKSLANEQVELPEAALNSVHQQMTLLHTVQQLAAFQQGAVGLQAKCHAYLASLHANPEGFTLQGGILPTDYFIAAYKALLTSHHSILNHYPNLKVSARIFSVQLHCFGMTYGLGHIRQDSSVFINFWSTVFNDLGNDPACKTNAIVTLLNHKNYAELALDERMQVQKLLINGSRESRELLSLIYAKYKSAAYQTPAFSIVCRELKRFELAIQHQDLFDNVIISNCESAANIFEVQALLDIIPHPSSHLKIVPLLEKRQDLENYELILLHYLKFLIQQQIPEARLALADLTSRAELRTAVAANPAWRKALNAIEFEVMVGFSDTERVSGITALISIQKVKENILLLAKDLGVQVRFYHGPGGDANRGGLARRDEKGTLQGNARSNLLTTPNSTLRYREAQFYRAYHEKAYPLQRIELAAKPLHIQQGIERCQKEGVAFYEYLHDTENGLGKLFGTFLGHGPHWLVSLLNLSSRASQRGVAEQQGDRASAVQTGGVRPGFFCNLDKLRAITATQCKEVLRDNTHLIIGPGRGLRSINLSYAERLLDSSETMRDLFFKAVLGLSFANYSVTAHALFADYPHLRPQSIQQRKEWAQECMTYPQRLKGMSIENLLNNKGELLVMLSRLFAFLEEECEQTKKVVHELLQTMHGPKNTSSPLLSAYPEWHAYAQQVSHAVEPLSLLLARQTHHVAQGRALDQVYQGLNQQPYAASKLSAVSRLLANIGAGITAFRIMPPAFCDLNYRDDLRLGVTRAEQEFNKPIISAVAKNGTFFDKKITGPIEECLMKQVHRASNSPSSVL